MKRCLASLVLLLSLTGDIHAQTFDHAEFDVVLRAHTAGGAVRYATLQADRAGLDRYISRLAAVTPAQYAAWNRPEQIAYLVNAYNAIVMQQVINDYPIRRSLSPAALIRPANSIWQIGGFFDGRRHTVAGRRLTLDDIEHKLLRAELKEPRIHAALVCAAVSCPPLRSEAYTADRLDAQFDDQWRRFLGDADRNRVDRSRNELKLSEIFKWFADDFGGSDGVIRFIAAYVDEPTQRWLRERAPRVTYIDYDWTLNDASAR